MSTKISKLKDKDGNELLPKTLASCVTTSDDKTIEQKFSELDAKDTAQDASITSINSSLSNLCTFKDDKVIGTYNGETLYRGVYTYSNISLPINTTVSVTTSFINYAKIVNLSVSAIFETGFVNGGDFLQYYVENDTLKVMQTFTSYSTKKIIAIVYYTN